MVHLTPTEIFREDKAKITLVCFGDGEPCIAITQPDKIRATLVLSREEARVLGEALLAAAEKGVGDD